MFSGGKEACKKKKKKKIERSGREITSTRETGTLVRYHTVWLCIFPFARSFPFNMYLRDTAL